MKFFSKGKSNTLIDWKVINELFQNALKSYKASIHDGEVVSKLKAIDFAVSAIKESYSNPGSEEESIISQNVHTYASSLKQDLYNSFVSKIVAYSEEYIFQNKAPLQHYIKDVKNGLLTTEDTTKVLEKFYEKGFYLHQDYIKKELASHPLFSVIAGGFARTELEWVVRQKAHAEQQRSEDIIKAASMKSFLKEEYNYHLKNSIEKKVSNLGAIDENKKKIYHTSAELKMQGSFKSWFESYYKYEEDKVKAAALVEFNKLLNVRHTECVKNIIEGLKENSEVAFDKKSILKDLVNTLVGDEKISEEFVQIILQDTSSNPELLPQISVETSSY